MMSIHPWLLCCVLLVGCDKPEAPSPEPPRFQLFADSVPGDAPRIRLFAKEAGDHLPFDMDPKTLTADRVPPERFLVQQVHDGYLIGTNVGEFGGRVLWFSPDGKKQAPLVDDNCIGIIMDGDRALLLTGLAHLSGASGTLHKLARQADGRWKLVRSLLLSGTPKELHWTPRGDLQIDLVLPAMFLFRTTIDNDSWEACGQRLLFRAGVLRIPFETGPGN